MRLMRPTVLVVEDEALIRLSAAMMVEEVGYGVLEAESADEAMRLLDIHPEISIVFTDIRMAGSMDGLELAKLAHERWPPLKFIVVSGNYAAAAAELPPGARFFSKPYTSGTITEALRQLAA